MFEPPIAFPCGREPFDGVHFGKRQAFDNAVGK